MTVKTFVATTGMVLIISFVCSAVAQEVISDSPRLVRIGAVAYRPSVVTVFQNLTTYLDQNGFASDYVLYSNYDALVEALERGEVDVAWNSPLAHAKYHVRNQCTSQTLAMRDIDQNNRVTLIARADSGIGSLKDLSGKRLILGRSGSPEGALLPVYYLEQAQVDIDSLKIVSLDQERDSDGKLADGPKHILQALTDGRGDAAIIPERIWKQTNANDPKNSAIKKIWNSPPFSHCVFTAPQDFDGTLASQFTRLMTNMDPTDPLIAELMRLEHTKKWLPADAEGFEDLVNAIQYKEVQSAD